MSEQVVLLRNVSGRMQTIGLEHAQAPRLRHVHHLRSRKRDGKIGIERQRLGIYDSIILLAGEEKTLLPLYVASVPDVVRLKAANKIEVEVLSYDEALGIKQAAEERKAGEATKLAAEKKIKAEKRAKIAAQFAAKMAAKSKKPSKKPKREKDSSKDVDLKSKE